VPDPYAVDARFYDLLHPEDGADVGLWLSYAGRTDLPVLEVGTGTGRIALALAAAGHRVTALDPSPAMLEQARRKAAEKGLIDRLELIEDLSGRSELASGTFGLALVPADVFLYSADGEAQLSTLRSLAGCLAYNGLLAVDLPGPAAWLDASTDGLPVLVFSGDFEGERLDAWQVREDDLAAQRRVLRMFYERTGADGAVRRVVSEHSLRYVYRFEMEYLIHMAGLALLDVYGDYELGPLTGDSQRMLFIARRTGD
jgi:SAM-dependent methyltransferase